MRWRLQLAACVAAVQLIGTVSVSAQMGSQHQPAAQDDWLRESKTIDSKYYIIRTDVHRDFYPVLKRHLDGYYRAIHEMFKTLGVKTNPKETKCEFHFYANQSDYIRCTGKSPDVLGHYHLGDKIIRSWMPAPYFTGEDKDGLSSALDTILHEAFHQILHRVCGEPGYEQMSDIVPLWLNEGMAEFIGTSVRTPDGLFTGEIPLVGGENLTYHNFMKLLEAGALLKASSLIQLSADSWHELLGTYCQSHLLVHFFIYGDNGAHRAWFGEVLQAAIAGRSWQKALDNRYTESGRLKLDARYRAFLSELRPNDMEEAILKAIFLAHGIYFLEYSQSAHIVNGTSLNEILLHLQRSSYFYDFGIDYEFRRISSFDQYCLDLPYTGAVLRYRRLQGVSSQVGWHNAVVWTEGLEPRDIEVRWNVRLNRWQVPAY